MIIGIGTDIVAVNRIQQALDRHGMLFAQRILSDGELLVLHDVREPLPWLAKRWAAKEAFGKAAGIGIRSPLSLTGIGVTHDAMGKPQFALALAAQHFIAARGVEHIHLSISDEKDYALAFVVFEGDSLNLSSSTETGA